MFLSSKTPLGLNKGLYTKSYMKLYDVKNWASATITGIVMILTIVVSDIIPTDTSVFLPNFCASIPLSAAEGAEHAIIQDVATFVSHLNSRHTPSAVRGEMISLKTAPTYTHRLVNVAFTSIFAR